MLAGVTGLEPATTVLETATLPIELHPYKLYYKTTKITLYHCRTIWFIS